MWRRVILGQVEDFLVADGVCGCVTLSGFSDIPLKKKKNTATGCYIIFVGRKIKSYVICTASLEQHNKPCTHFFRRYLIFFMAASLTLFTDSLWVSTAEQHVLCTNLSHAAHLQLQLVQMKTTEDR